jgi:glycosyltransferase involved in cell wall biosynthesis
MTPAPEGGAAPADNHRRPLRVCMVHYSDVHVDSRIQRQALALAARGDEVDLICLSPDGELPAPGGRIRIHEISVAKASGGARNYLRGYGAFIAGALRRVAALDRIRRFDLVEAHNMPDAIAFAGLVPKLRGVPLILNVHDTFPELFATKFGGRPLLARALRAEERLSARFANAVIVVTPEAGELLAARGASRRRIEVVMNTPDSRVFGPARPPVSAPDGEPVRVIYHGGLAPRFGVDVLVRAIGLLAGGRHDVRLRICGTGDAERARLIALAAEVAPAHIDIAPEAVPFERIPAELEAAHLGVVPTLLDDFTGLLMPVKLMEYVHMGLPAVASALGPIERHLGADAVRLVTPGDAAALADAISATLDDPAAAHRRAELAQARLSAFGWDVQRRRYLDLVDDLVGPRAARRRPARRVAPGGREARTEEILA